jgi:glyoxylase I family protein
VHFRAVSRLAFGRKLLKSAPVNFTIEHIGLAAAHPEALKDWYVRVLDGEVVYADGQQPPAFFVRLGGGLMVELYASQSRLEQVGQNQLAGWRHLALRVESIERARDFLTRRGVEFDAQIKPAGGGGRVLFFKDPEGNLWHLVERPMEVGWAKSRGDASV